MEELKLTIAKNITRFRTLKGLTQYELAERLNYTDKSVSKWERGQGLPDIIVLKKMAEVFGTTVDELLKEHNDMEIKIPQDPKAKKLSKIVITLLACGLVWLVATMVYVALTWLSVKGGWKCFIYAIPLTALVITIFCAIWAKKWCTALSMSVLSWTTLMSIYITFIGTRAWLLFFVGIPVQVLVILWLLLVNILDRKRKLTSTSK